MVKSPHAKAAMPSPAPTLVIKTMLAPTPTSSARAITTTATTNTTTINTANTAANTAKTATSTTKTAPPPAKPPAKPPVAAAPAPTIMPALSISAATLAFSAPFRSAVNTLAADPFLPGSPSRRPLTPFMIFAAEMRATVAVKGRLRSPAENGRELCRMWADLSKEKRNAFVQRARNELLFVQKLSKQASRNTSAKKRKSRDPSAPRSAMTAYMFYSKAARSRIKDKNPTATFGELGRLIGHEWRELSPAAKKPFEELAKQDKARYVTAKALYTSRQPPGATTKKKGDKSRSKKRAKASPSKSALNKQLKAAKSVATMPAQLRLQRGLKQQLLMPKQPPPVTGLSAVMARPMMAPMHSKPVKASPRVPVLASRHPHAIPLVFRPSPAPPPVPVPARHPDPVAGKVVMIPPPVTRGVHSPKKKRKKVSHKKPVVAPAAVQPNPLTSTV